MRLGRGPRLNKKRYDFCEGAQGKDLGGSLEGGVVQEHDPATYGVGGPMGGERSEAGICAPDLQHQRMSKANGVSRSDDEAVARHVMSSSMAS